MPIYRRLVPLPEEAPSKFPLPEERPFGGEDQSPHLHGAVGKGSQGQEQSALSPTRATTWWAPAANNNSRAPRATLAWVTAAAQNWTAGQIQQVARMEPSKIT